MAVPAASSDRNRVADRRALARVRWAEGDATGALASLRGALAATTDLEALNDLGVVALETHGAETARAIFTAVLAVDPDRRDAAENLAALGEVDGSWRASATLGGPDPTLPERAFPGMPNARTMCEHAQRYAFVLRLVEGASVLDLGCGTGYGSEMLTWTAASVRGFDRWRPAPSEQPAWPGGARLTWGHDLCRDPLPSADAAVAFEVLEHLDDAPAALRHAWRAVSMLALSFPNPVYHGSHHNPYHVNDWPLDRVEEEVWAAAVATRFPEVELVHFHQGDDGAIRPGRDPEASYWLVVAAGAPAPAAAPATNAMKRDWDERARRNAMHYVASGREQWDEDAFSESGRASVEQLVDPDLSSICAGRDPSQLRALEIGCGLGRMTEHLATRFGEVHGVDVSGEMARRARERLARLGNVYVHETDGATLPFPDGCFDFAFSFICFQHVPDKEAVLTTLRETFRVLVPGSLFKFQVQGSQDPRYVAAAKDTWHGATFSADELRAAAGELGFAPLRSEGEGTQYFWQWWRKP